MWMQCGKHGGGDEVKEFGEWLQGELNSRGLTPTKFAQSIGVSHASVSRWLSGERRPKRVHAYKISQALGVSPDTMKIFGYDLSDNSGERIIISPGNDSYSLCEFLINHPEYIQAFEGLVDALESKLLK